MITILLQKILDLLKEKLKDLTFLVTNPQNGDALIYDAETGKWKNKEVSSGGGGEDITDTITVNTSIFNDASHRVVYASKSGGVVSVSCNDLHISTNPERQPVAGDIMISGLPKPINEKNVLMCNTSVGTNSIMKINNNGELVFTGTLKPNNGQWLIGEFEYITNS